MNNQERALLERIDKKEREIGELSNKGLSYSIQIKQRRILLAKLQKLNSELNKTPKNFNKEKAN
jgi:hypothetical protein